MIETSESIDKLSAALAKAQSEFKVAKKSATNPFLKNNYSNLSDTYQAVKPALAANGISLVQSSDICDGNIQVTQTRLVHTSGQWLQTTMSMMVNKTDPQAMGSLLSYSRRYAVTQMLCIDTGEADDDGNRASGTGLVSKKPLYEVAAAVKAQKGTTPKFTKEVANDDF